MDLFSISITFIAGVAMGGINNLAGGAGIFALWAFQYVCGLPLAVANPSARLGAVGVGLFAWLGFLRAGLIPERRIWKLALYAVPGALIGNFLALKGNDLLFRSYLTVVLVWLIAQHFRRRLPTPISGSSRFLGPLGCALIGLHMGFVQVGTGFVAALVLLATYDRDLLQVNAAKSVVVISASLASLVGFVLAPVLIAGQAPVIAWGPAICLAFGTATGSFMASKWSVSKGSASVRRMVLVIALVSLADQIVQIVILLAGW